jgi:hypothetical protein
MAKKGNNTADNLNRGKLTCKCLKCNKDMELVKVKGIGANGMYLVCECGERTQYTKGLYKEFQHYIKK